MAGRLVTDRTLSRAPGCLLGQLAGDALGSLVEFRTPEDIVSRYPKGVRELQDGGAWNTIAQNAASPATSLYWSLHTADPGDGGSQTTNEICGANVPQPE